jgi:hypothetical protein
VHDPFRRVASSHESSHKILSAAFPTNNAAELALRKPVILRKPSFGNEAQTGSRNLAAIMSATDTCRQ